MVRGRSGIHLWHNTFQVLLPATNTRQKVVVSPTAGISTCPYTCTTPRFSSYFDNFHLIDVHDHMRQGVLKLEQHWLIQNLVHRVLSTLFRVIIRLLPDVFIQHKCRVDFHEYVLLHWHSSWSIPIRVWRQVLHLINMFTWSSHLYVAVHVYSAHIRWKEKKIYCHYQLSCKTTLPYLQ
jgi:hypothetical protein